MEKTKSFPGMSWQEKQSEIILYLNLQMQQFIFGSLCRFTSLIKMSEISQSHNVWNQFELSQNTYPIPQSVYCPISSGKTLVRLNHYRSNTKSDLHFSESVSVIPLSSVSFFFSFLQPRSPIWIWPPWGSTSEGKR